MIELLSEIWIMKNHALRVMNTEVHLHLIAGCAYIVSLPAGELTYTYWSKRHQF
jgi:hypothetical protein